MTGHHLQTFSSASGQQLNTVQSVTACLSSKKKLKKSGSCDGLLNPLYLLVQSWAVRGDGPTCEGDHLQKNTNSLCICTPSFYFLIRGHTVSFVVLFSVIGHLITAAFVWTPSLLQPSEPGLQQSGPCPNNDLWV